MTTTAVQQLRDIREQWGDLLAAIAVPPAPVWPPVQPSVQHLAADDTDGPHVGRLPLVLRQHPAPANLDALDAAVAIEQDLFDLADRIAAAVQTPVRTRRLHHPQGGSSDTTYRPTHRPSRTDQNDPDRWHLPSDREALLGSPARLMTGTDPRTDKDRDMEALRGRPRVRRTEAALGNTMPVAAAGSRALGLHWAACWIADRLAATEPTDLHGIVRGVLRDHAERVTAEAHRILLAALGRDGRDTVLADPCPWCHGVLTARTTSGDPAAATITCDTGPTCTAPTPYDQRARRTWHGRDLVQLHTALQAARAAA